MSKNNIISNWLNTKGNKEITKKVKEKLSDKYTTPYSISEKDYQIKEMKNLGINTECQTFEQCVNSLIYIIKNDCNYNVVGDQELWKDITCG
jgi:hypothetical protein